MTSAKTHLKGHDDISILYAYSPDMTELLCSKVYPGNMLDAKAFDDFIAENNINRGILICDKRFPVSNIVDLPETNPELHNISPLRRNGSIISKHKMLESDQVTTLDNDNVVMYKMIKLDGGRCLYCIRNIGRSNFEKERLQYRALTKDCKFNGESFINKLASHGTITFIIRPGARPLSHY